MKVLTIIKDNGITGIEYGMVEVPEQRKQNNREGKIAKNIHRALFAIV